MMTDPPAVIAQAIFNQIGKSDKTPSSM